MWWLTKGCIGNFSRLFLRHIQLCITMYRLAVMKCHITSRHNNLNIIMWQNIFLVMGAKCPEVGILPPSYCHCSCHMVYLPLWWLQSGFKNRYIFTDIIVTMTLCYYLNQPVMLFYISHQNAHNTNFHIPKGIQDMKYYSKRYVLSTMYLMIKHLNSLRYKAKYFFFVFLGGFMFFLVFSPFKFSVVFAIGPFCT